MLILIILLKKDPLTLKPHFPKIELENMNEQDKILDERWYTNIVRLVVSVYIEVIGQKTQVPLI